MHTPILLLGFFVVFRCGVFSEARVISHAYFNPMAESSSQRFRILIGASNTDTIVVIVTVNVSEDAPVGSLVASFQAESKTATGKQIQLVSLIFFLVFYRTVL